MRLLGCVVFVLTIVLAGAPLAQEIAPPGIPAVVIPLSGRIVGTDGAVPQGSVQLTISLYAQPDDQSPIWVEHQAAVLTNTGAYSVLAGSTRAEGIPRGVLQAGVRWAGVALNGEAEQPRIPLVSVPYAARAASADTVGGHTANDFLLSDRVVDAVRHALETPAITARVRTGGFDVLATANVVPKWDNSLNLVETPVTSVGNFVGIRTANPLFTLDVTGDIAFRGAMFVGAGGGGPLRGRLTHRTGSFIVESLGDALLVLSGNGSDNHLVLDKAGNVGVGTRTPDEELHIEAPDNGRLKMTRAGVDNVLLGDIGSANDGGLLLYDGAGALKVLLRANGTTFINGGNVGIGTSSPTAKLHVAGTGRFDGTVTSNTLTAKHQDVAEWVEAAEPLEPGTLVVIDATAGNRVTASSSAYDSRVAGAVSAQPGVMLGESGPGRVLVAQSGRVRIKVDAANGAIRPGDLLVTSARRGYAMRARPVRVGGVLMQRPGTVLGKALEPLAHGSGEILALLTLQ